VLSPKNLEIQWQFMEKYIPSFMRDLVNEGVYFFTKMITGLQAVPI
jgi:hypothetical protein